MNEKELKKLEKLFVKYGKKSIQEVETDKKFLEIKTYKIELNNNEVIYRDKLIKNGNDGSACIVVPILENNDVIMVVQPRVFSLKGVLLDFPSGYIEKGEDPLNAALRELQEETGYTADNIKSIASYYQDEGVSDARINVFLATGLRKVSDLNLDEDEYIEPFVTNFDNLDELVDKGYIQSGGAQLAICKIKLLRGEKSC